MFYSGIELVLTEHRSRTAQTQRPLAATFLLHINRPHEQARARPSESTGKQAKSESNSVSKSPFQVPSLYLFT
jgi:hypothetical protein